MNGFLDQAGLGVLWTKLKETFVRKEAGKGLSTNDFTTEEKDKLKGLANYTHPTAAGSKHIPSGGAEGQVLRWSADGTAEWGADITYGAMQGASEEAAGAPGLVPAPAAGAQSQFLRGDGTWGTPANTTYTPASIGEDGLLSKEDKAKLDAFGAAADYALKSDIAAVYRYKGSVENQAALPAADNAVGDVYNVEDTNMNYGWTGEAWDPLGSTLSVEAISAEQIEAILNS